MIDVTVHIDPEDDETGTPCGNVPMRGVMLERLRSYWGNIPGAERVEDVALHYLGGRIRVEARIPLDTMTDLDHARRFAKDLAEVAYQDEYVTEVKVLFF